MNIAEFSIRKQVVTVTLTLVLLVAGILAFMNLPRLEDPAFTIKEAIISTPYPGASAAEVEEEVAEEVEVEAEAPAAEQKIDEEPSKSSDQSAASESPTA